MEDNKSKLHKFWAGQINSAKKREDKWRRESDKIVKRYRDGGPRNGKGEFNILWANTEILKAAVLSSVSPPHVTRRYRDEDLVGKEVSEILERGLEFQRDEETFVRNLRKCRDDMLLVGRGVIWFEYDADYEMQDMDRLEMPPQVNEAGELIESEAVFLINGMPSEPDSINPDGIGQMEFQTAQRVSSKYIYWKDYLQSDSRSEEDVWWKARRHGLSKDEIESQLGSEAVQKIELPQETNDEGTEIFEVWELWNKTKKQRVWFTDNATDVLEVEDVPIKLTTFFPCPKPIFPFETNSTMVPVPEYMIYQEQAVELNRIVRRLTTLTEQLKVAGVYNGADKDALVDLSSLQDGQYKAIKNAAAFGEKGGFAGSLFSMPIGEVAGVIAQLEARKSIIKGEIYEITGISDLVRGDTQANETATAQRLKGSYGSLRLRPRREPMEEFIRESYRIMAEIMADEFSPESFARMTGIEPTPEVMELMRNDKMRDFRVDVETDSTVQPNEMIDQSKAVEYSQVISNMLGQGIPAIQAFPQIAPFLAESLKFIARQFKTGRGLEIELSKLTDAVEQSPQQQAQQQQAQNVDPEAQAKQMEAQIKQAEMQIKAQDMATKAQTAQMNNQTKLQVAQINAQVKMADTQVRANSEAERNQTTIRKNELDVLAGQRGFSQ